MNSINHFEYLVLFSLIEKIHRNTPFYPIHEETIEQNSIEKRQQIITDNASHIAQYAKFYSIFVPENCTENLHNADQQTDNEAVLNSGSYHKGTLFNTELNNQFSELTSFWAEKIFAEQAILEDALDAKSIDFIKEFSNLHQKQIELIQRYQESISIQEISFAHLKDIFEHIQDLSREEQNTLFEWAQKSFYKRLKQPKEVKKFKKMVLKEKFFTHHIQKNTLTLLKKLDQIYDKLFYLEKDVAFLETQFTHLCSQYRINRSRQFLENRTTTTNDENIYLLEHISAIVDEGEKITQKSNISQENMWNAINGWAFFRFYSDNHQWNGWKEALERISQLNATDIPENVRDEHKHLQSLTDKA